MERLRGGGGRGLGGGGGWRGLGGGGGLERLGGGGGWRGTLARFHSSIAGLGMKWIRGDEVAIFCF
jgi:hypothetical protein